MEENGRNADRIREDVQTRAYVRNLVEDLVRQLEEDQALGEEPVSPFTVKLPITDLARLERIGAYLGYKKTPFASMLLQQAVEDAWWALLQASEDQGKRDEVAAYLQGVHELEDGSGTVGPMRGGV